MKNNSLILIILTALPVMLTVLVILFLPDTVPVHYNFSGGVDRWGSRYELLVFPLTTVAVIIFFLLINRYFHKTGDSCNIKIAFRISVLTMVLLNIMLIVGLTAVFIDATHKILQFSFPVTRILFILVGIVFIPLGQWITKTQRNSIMGVRVRWSLTSDYNWLKAQHAGKWLLIVYGLLLITANVFISQQQQLANFISLAILLSMVPSCLILNYFLRKQSSM